MLGGTGLSRAWGRAGPNPGPSAAERYRTVPNPEPSGTGLSRSRWRSGSETGRTRTERYRAELSVPRAVPKGCRTGPSCPEAGPVRCNKSPLRRCPRRVPLSPAAAMLIKEYHILLPMSLEEYQVAQLYMIQVGMRG